MTESGPTGSPVGGSHVDLRRNWLVRWWHSLGVDSLAAFGLGALVLTFIDLHALTNRALDYGDLTVPYLRGTALAELSAPNPWYSLLAKATFLIAPGGYGLVLNVVDVYSFALAPVAMLVLLRQFGVPRVPRFAGAMFYLVNPVVLAEASPGFYSWSLFLILAPLILAALVAYEQANGLRYLLVGLLLVVVLLQLDPTDGLRLIAPLLVGSLALPWLTRRVKPARRMALDYAAALVLLGALLAIDLLPSVARLSYDFSAGSTSSSTFFAFHMANVTFTYHAQTLANSLSALALYPTGHLAQLGYADTAVWALWLVIIVLAMAMTAVACLFEGRFSHEPNRAHYATFLGLAGVLVGLQVGISTGVLLGMFRHAPFLFDYEYPTIFNYIQIVLYTVFFAVLVDRSGRIIRGLLPSSETRATRFSLGGANYILIVGRTARARPAAARGGSPVARRLAGPGVTLAVVAVLLLAANYPTFSRGSNDSLNPTTDSASFLPAYYSQLGSFFLSQGGVYRVLPLPLNYSSIIWLESALPHERIFGIPYAGVNSPGEYPNSTVLLTVLQAIVANATAGLAQLLAQDNVRYVLVENPETTTPFKLDTSGYNIYLTGGGRDFLEVFGSAPGFQEAASSPNYVVLEDTLYAAPAVVPPDVITYSAETAGTVGPSPPPRELLIDSNLSSAAAWTSWTSCAGPKSSYIDFGTLEVSLRDCSGPDATGSSTHTPQTEIYQRTAVFPGERLILEANLSGGAVGDATLIVIFHNATDDSGFYSSQQYFPSVTDLAAAHYFYNVTAPPAATYAYVGIQTFNSSGAIANVTLSGFDAFSQYAFANVTAYAGVPVVTSGTVLVADQGAIVALAPYYSTVVEASPSETLEASQVPLALGTTASGTLFVGAGWWNFSLPCRTGGTSEDYADLAPSDVNATFNGSLHGASVNASGWLGIPGSCAGGSSFVSLEVNGAGYVGVSALFTLSGPSSGSETATVTLVPTSTAAYRLTASAPGLASLYTVEVALLNPSGSARVVASAPLNGGRLYVLNVSVGSSVVVVFPILEPVSSVTVVSNIAVMVLAAGGLVLLASQRLYRRGVALSRKVLRREAP